MGICKSPSIYTTYAKSEKEATERQKKFDNVDPFPYILPALLNSADIKAYVKTTALIYPFNEKKLSGASYNVPIQGDVVYWKYEADGRKEKKIIKLEKEGDSFILEPNSIAFVTLEPFFHIPSYLALRFNLKITHIYKGLLLGTGPLVDPSFCGKLSIPLHNLTSNSYTFQFNDDLITMEFTKMSDNSEWNNGQKALNIGHKETYCKNQIPSDRTVHDYLSKALRNDHLDSIVSSIPDAVQDCKKEAKAANAEAKAANTAAEKAKNSSYFQAGISVIAVCTLVVSTIGFSLNAVNKANDRYDSLWLEHEQCKEYESTIKSLQEEIDRLADRISEIESSASPSDTVSTPDISHTD